MRLEGERLREERTRRGLSVEDVARAIKVRPRFIRAMEEGRVEELPPGVVGKGFVRAYARYLGIPLEEVFQEGTPEAPSPSRGSRPLWPYLVACLGAVGLLVGILGRGEREVGPSQPPEAISVPPALNQTLPQGAVPPEIEVPSQVHLLEIEAMELTWIEIRKGDDPPYDITLYPGDRYRVEDPRGFSLKIGNAAGVRVTFDGRELGPLGERGQVVRIRLP